jgi:hypothetical protein
MKTTQLLYSSGQDIHESYIWLDQQMSHKSVSHNQLTSEAEFEAQLLDPKLVYLEG